MKNAPEAVSNIHVKVLSFLGEIGVKQLLCVGYSIFPHWLIILLYSEINKNEFMHAQIFAFHACFCVSVGVECLHFFCFLYAFILCFYAIYLFCVFVCPEFLTGNW